MGKRRGVSTQRFLLDNGLVSRLDTISDNPLLVLAVAFPAGACREEDDLGGLAYLTSAMLERGCGEETRKQIAEDVDRRGARFHLRQGRDALTLEFSVLKEDIDWAFERLSRLLRFPSFPEDEFAKLKNEAIGQAKSRAEDPRDKVNEIFGRTIAPGHAYGRPVGGTLESIERLTVDKVRDFYSRFYGPRGGVLSLAGDLELDRAQKLVEKWFAPWAAGTEDFEPMDPPHPERMTLETEAMDLEQAKVVLGFPAIRRLDPDFYPLMLLNYLFGGAFRSRLTRRIRSKEGLAYAVGSNFTAGRSRGLFRVSLQTKNEQADYAIAAVFSEVDRLKSEAVDPQELEEAKTSLTLSYPLDFDTCAKIASRSLETEFYELPEDRWTDYREGIASVTAVDLQRVAHRLFQPDRAAVAVVADLQKAKLGGPSAWVTLSSEDRPELEIDPPPEVPPSPAPTRAPLKREGRAYETTLDNGLRLLVLPVHKSPVASLQVWYGVGSRNEPRGKTGVSHMLEHMMFRGSPKYADGKFDQLLSLHGGVNNAFTTEDFTAYYENMASDAVWLALELEADRMRELTFTDEDFEKEREVVVEERRLRTEDSPSGLMFEQMQATAFSAHPYRNPIIGWMSDIRRYTAEDLRRHHRLYYGPRNASIVACGDVEPELIAGWVQDLFGGLEAGSQPPEVLTQEPPQLGEKRYTVRKHAGYQAFMFGYHVPNHAGADRHALEILASIMSEGASSRLNQKLIAEKELLLNVWGYYDPMVYDPTLFYLGAEFAMDKDPQQVEEEIYAVLDQMKTEPVTEEELEKARRQWESEFVMKQDDVEDLAHLAGAYHILDHWSLLERDRQAVKKVTAEDLMRVAETYLVDRNRTVGRLIPES